MVSETGDWKKTQEKDTRLQYWRKMVETGQKPEKEDTILKCQFSHLHFINDVLHRQVTNNDKDGVRNWGEFVEDAQQVDNSDSESESSTIEE
jgi:hypothetical protein